MVQTKTTTKQTQKQARSVTTQSLGTRVQGLAQAEDFVDAGPSLHRYVGNGFAQGMAASDGLGASPPALTPLRPSPSGILQRKCACGNLAVGGRCSACSKKQRLDVQTKLEVNEPGDIYEREADRVADQILATPAHHDVSGAPPRIQRFSGPSPARVNDVPASVDQALASPGRPLEPAVRQEMEQRFRYDFSDVRVHSAAAAAQSAQDMNAHAYTVGHDIVFAAGRFSPGTNEGQRLIAHELTHVVHQTGRGVPAIQRKEKENQHNVRTVTQITVEAKTTGEERGRALMSDGQTLLISVEVNNLTPSRITTGKLLLGSKVEDWKQIHLGSMGANLFVFELPPGVTLGQTLTIVVEPTAKERAETQIRALKKHTRDFLIRDKRRKASHQDLLKAASAGQILEKYGVTEDELLLQEQRRIDLEEIGLQRAESFDPQDWALSYVGLRAQARAAEQANATTLLQATERLSLASLNLYQQDPLLELVDPRSRISALATANAIRFKETRPMRGPSEKVETPFRDLGDLRTTLQTFENALVADLRTLATSFLDDTEVRLIRMQRQFVGRGDKQWGPGYLEREIEKIKQDPDVIEVQKAHDEIIRAIDQEQREDDQNYRGRQHVRWWVDAYYKRQKERQGKREEKQRRYRDSLRQTVAKKSKLKLSPGFDVGDILSANSGRAQTILRDSIVSGRAKVREARAKLSDPKFLYAADIVIAKEKEFLSHALAARSDCNRFREGTLEHVLCKGFAAKRRDTVNWIIDKLARERRAQTTLWQDIWKVFEFAANFIPGPIGWATRLAVAAVSFDQKIERAATQSVLYRTGMSENAPDPNAASSALGEFGLQVVTDLPFSRAIKGTKQLTFGLEKNLSGGAAKLGERGVTNALEKQVIKPPVPKTAPLKPTRELDQARLFKKPPVNNTDIDRAAVKREAAKPRPRKPPHQQVQEVTLAASPAANENVRVLTDIEKAAQKRAAATRRPQEPPQQQMAEATLAPTGTGDVIPAKVVETSGTRPDTSRLSMVANGGGTPPGRKPTPSGSVRPPETPASQTTTPPAPASTPTPPRSGRSEGQTHRAHPRLIPRAPAQEAPRSLTPEQRIGQMIEEEIADLPPVGNTPLARDVNRNVIPRVEPEPTQVEIAPLGQQDLRGSVTTSGGSPSHVATTARGEISQPPSGAGRQAEEPALGAASDLLGSATTAEKLYRSKKFLEAKKELQPLIDQINPCQGTMNCVPVTIATDMSLATGKAFKAPVILETTGVKEVATRTGPLEVSEATEVALRRRVLESYVGANLKSTGARALFQELHRAGHGARAIIAKMGEEIGHAYNVINWRGTLIAVDGQSRTIRPFAEVLAKMVKNNDDWTMMWYRTH